MLLRSKSHQLVLHDFGFGMAPSSVVLLFSLSLNPGLKSRGLVIFRIFSRPMGPSKHGMFEFRARRSGKPLSQASSSKDFPKSRQLLARKCHGVPTEHDCHNLSTPFRSGLDLMS